MRILNAVDSVISYNNIIFIVSRFYDKNKYFIIDKNICSCIIVSFRPFFPSWIIVRVARSARELNSIIQLL